MSLLNITGQARGFTLIELLVAVMLFVVLSVMAYGGLNVVLQGQQRYEENADNLAALQTAFLLMKRDIEQAVDRPVRDNYGDQQPAVKSDGQQLEMTRTGLRNPAALERSHIQRVGYQLDDHKLYRFAWPVIDRAQDSEPYKSLVLDHVNELEIRFLDQQDEWQAQWPKQAVSNDVTEAMPRAFEVTIDVSEWGRVTRLFMVPASPPQERSNEKA